MNSTPTSPSGDGLSRPSPSLRVLLVDDHPDLLSMLGLMMSRRQYAVQTAASGSEALELASDFSPHVVISDIGMPEMDGFELMAQLRSADLSPFRSIALSGYDLSGGIEEERALQAGYDAHLTKPIEFEKLFEIIENFAHEMGE